MQPKNHGIVCQKTKNRLSSFLNLFEGRAFAYLFLLNIVSNCSYVYTDRAVLPLVMMICLSASWALIEVIVFRCLSKIRILGKGYLIMLSIVYTTLIIVDYFCISNFQTTFNQSKLDIIRETNLAESAEFLSNYLSISMLFNIIIGGGVHSILHCFSARLSLQKQDINCCLHAHLQ